MRPLARDLEQRHAGRDGDIQALHPAVQRNGGEEVAVIQILRQQLASREDKNRTRLQQTSMHEQAETARKIMKINAAPATLSQQSAPAA